MDKETLSNYGWIVICVLVLAVMLALATPFGTFIADGFKATYTGLFDTGDSALDVGLSAVGVTNTLECGHGRKESGDHSQLDCGHFACEDCGCVPASCGCENHWSGDGLDHTTVVNHTGSSYAPPHTYACECDNFVVPEGVVYKPGWPINGKSEFAEGETIKCNFKPGSSDSFTYGDYRYYMSSDGWKVMTLDKTKESYGEILDSFCSIPVTSLTGTFSGCTQLKNEGMPSIPNTIINMKQAFYGCTSLTDLSDFVIPSSVTDMTETFARCSSLVVAPKLPDNVTNLYQTFYYCEALTSAPYIPSSVTSMAFTFRGCTSLVIAPDLSQCTNITNMEQTFMSCSSLTTAPFIGNCTQLATLDSTFSGCTNLKTYHGSQDPDGDFSKFIIPSTARNMLGTFSNCRSMIIAPVIPEGVVKMHGTFSDCRALTTFTKIPSTVTNMDSTFRACLVLTGTIEIKTEQLDVSQMAFYQTSKKITLVGTGTNDTVLQTLVSTASNSNVKIQ